MRPKILFLAIVAITLNIGQMAAQSESTRNYLWKQCIEPVLVLRLDPAPFEEILGSDFSLILEDGKATVAIIVQDCSQYWIDGEDLGPTQHAHVWVEVEGSRDARPVVGAEQSFPTRTWFSLFAGSTNPRGRKARSRSGTAPESIEGVLLDHTDSPGTGQVHVSPTLSYSWQVEPADQPARVMGFNNDVYVRTSSGKLVLKRIQALANAVQSKGTLKVVGGIEPQGLIHTGSYPVQVLIFLPVWARATLGESPVAGDHSRTLREAREKWSRAIAAGDLERIFSFWTDDVVIFPVSAPAVRGIDAVREYVIHNRRELGLKPRSEAIEMVASESGDLGYVIGRYEWIDRTGRAIDPGRYVTLWRKDHHDRWRCFLEIHSPLGDSDAEKK